MKPGFSPFQHPGAAHLSSRPAAAGVSEALLSDVVVMTHADTHTQIKSGLWRSYSFGIWLTGWFTYQSWQVFGDSQGREESFWRGCKRGLCSEERLNNSKTRWQSACLYGSLSKTRPSSFSDNLRRHKQLCEIKHVAWFTPLSVTRLRSISNSSCLIQVWINDLFSELFDETPYSLLLHIIYMPVSCMWIWMCASRAKGTGTF